MTSGHKITVSALVLTVLLIIVGSVAATYLIMDSRQRVAVTQAKADAAQEVIAEKQKIIDAANQATLTRDKTFGIWLAQHNNDTAAVNTVDKAVDALNKAGVGLQERASATDPKATEFLLPPDKAIPLFQKIAQCETTDKTLDKCQHDLEDKITIANAALSQRDEWKRTSDSWEKVAKGGSKLSRTWYALKIGGAAMAGSAPGALSKNPKEAVIGAGVGAMFCAIFCKH